MQRDFLHTLVAAGTLSLIASTAHAQSFLERLEEAITDGSRAAQQAAPADPIQEPGYLGLVADVLPDAGVVVLEVQPGGPADQAGLEEGDVIESIAGRAVDDLDQMAELLVDRTAGQQVDMRIQRAGESQQITVTLAVRPTARQPYADPELPEQAPIEPFGEQQLPPPPDEPYETGPRAAADRPSLGITVTDLTDALRRQHNIAVRRGALVTAVRPGSPAERAGISPGAVLVALDGMRVDSYRDVVHAVAARVPGDELELTYYEGNRLVRRSVQIGTSDPGATPTQEPGFDFNFPRRGQSDRPALRALGRALESLTGPEQGRPLGPMDEAGLQQAELLEQLMRMQDEIDQLRRRVEQLESEQAGQDAAAR